MNWITETKDKQAFSAYRNYDQGPYGGFQREELDIEWKHNNLLVRVEEGDAGGFGAERHGATIHLDRDTAEHLYRWLGEMLESGWSNA